jgi:hypothetical protein
MAQIIEIVYGLGGFDSSKPNNNIIEIVEGPDNDTEQGGGE